MIGRINDDNIKLKKSTITGNINSTFASLKFEQEYQSFSSDEIDCTFILDYLKDYVTYNLKIKINDKILKYNVRCNNEIENSNGENYDTFNFGQVQPNSSFTVIIECSFMAVYISEHELQFDIPFVEIYSDSQIECSITITETQQIKGIKNAPNLTFNREGKYTGQIISENPFQCTSQLSPIIEINGNIKDESVCLKIGGDTFIGISSCPSLTQSKSNSEIIVILDISGSMIGERISMAREALKQLLARLQYGTYFNIIFFNEFKYLAFDTTVEYNSENKSIAMNKIDIFTDANIKDYYDDDEEEDHEEEEFHVCGCTNLCEPLQFAYQQEIRKGYTRIIYVLTDGDVDNLNACLETILEYRNYSQLFLLGISKEASIENLEKMRDAGHGELKHIIDNTEISEVVLDQLQQSLNYSVPDVNLKVVGKKLIETAPLPIPPLFNKKLNHIFVRIPSKKPLKELKIETIMNYNAPIIQLSGNNYFSNMKSSCILENNPIRLDKLFAYYCIQDLENSIIMMPDQEMLDYLKNKVTFLSERYGIVSQFTSFWMIEDSDDENYDKDDSNKPIEIEQQINENQIQNQEQFDDVYNNVPEKVANREIKIQQIDITQPDIVEYIDGDKKEWNIMPFLFILLNFLLKLFFFFLFVLIFPIRLVAYFIKLFYKIVDHLIIDWIRVYKRTKKVTHKNINHAKVPEGEYSMEKVVNSQDYDGRWSKDKLDWILNCFEEEIKLSRYFAPTDDMQATVMALLLLKINEAEKENELNLIYKKGISWLTHNRNVDWNSILERLLEKKK